MKKLFCDVLPAGVLFATAGWLGSFEGSASFLGLAGLCLLVLGLAATAGPRWTDPFGLGRGGSAVLLLLVGLLVASWGTSPVPRAGRTALLLIPGFLLLPAVFARCWREKDGLRRGLLGISVAVLAVGLWALLHLWLSGGPRAAMPLGQHRLLASWLVCLLPLACLGALWPGLSRILAVAAGLVGAAAVVLSGSFLGVAALGLEVVVAVVVVFAIRRGRRGPGAYRWGAYRWGAYLLIAVALFGAGLLGVNRGKDLVTFQDSSMLARNVYWQAGWEGLGERPWLGWGPGSTPWTLATFLEPRPGINPPGELVGDLHNLPLGLAYEVGVPASLLTVALLALFWWRRRPGAWRPPEDSPEEQAIAPVFAAFLGFIGFAVTSLGGASLSVAALPVALSVVFGVALAGSGGLKAGPREDSAEVHRSLGWVPAVYAVVALLLLVSPLRAHRAYERALSGVDPKGVAVAADLDPHFPLYQERLASSEKDLLRAWKAASSAQGVVSPWLLAGVLATDAQPSISGGFLGEVCRLDPLAAAAPFLRLLVAPGAPDAVEWGARALFAEPRLLASPWWRGRRDLLERTVEMAQRQDGVDAGWRLSLQSTAKAVADRNAETLKNEENEGAEFTAQEFVAQEFVAQEFVAQEFVATADSRPGSFSSLHLFRRPTWPLELVIFDLDPEALALIDLPAATVLATTAPWVFQGYDCGLGEKEESVP